MRRCRHIILFLAVLLQAGAAWAQPQFRNTTSFDTGDSLYYWSARIGARTFQLGADNDTTTGYHVMNTCTYTPDLVGDSVIKSIMVHASYVTVPDTTDSAGYHIDTLNVFTDTCRDYGHDANNYRFFIYTDSLAGLDEFTVKTSVMGSGMPRIAPGYQTSIRLGCMVDSPDALYVDSNDCLIPEDREQLFRIRFALSQTDSLTQEQRDSLHSICPNMGDVDTLAFLNGALSFYDHGSQSLFYTMRVTPENALMIINFALVARRFDHDAFSAGEFLVRIVRRDSTGQWANAPINDSLWYKVSAPYSTTTVSDPWREGSTGENNPCRYVYKPWSKCAVNLQEFIGQDVRVEFYSSNCIYGVDPLYAYIAGDYTSPVLSQSGCPQGTSPFIDTIKAPEGMLAYEWFVSNDGPQEDLFDFAHLDTLSFRRLTGRVGSNIYCPTVTDFVLERDDTLMCQTFKCVMYSALDPAKPFTSKLYANVCNHKPVAQFKLLSSCDRTLTFISESRPPRGDSLDPSSLYWIIYSDPYGEEVLDTLYGDSVEYTFPETRSYLVDQHIAIYSDDSIPCSTVRRSFCPVKGPTEVGLRLSEHSICAGTEVRAECEFDQMARILWLDGSLQREWRVDGVPLRELTTPYTLTHDTVLRLPALAEGMHVIELLTENHYHCPSRSADTVYVYENPRILVDPKSQILCLGDTLTLTAFRDDRYLPTAWFEWSSVPPDPMLDSQQGSPVLYLSPEQDISYTLHPSPSSLCQLDDITVDITVSEYPVAELSYTPLVIDFDHPRVTLTDETPKAWSTHWYFDDGTVASGSHLSHIFTSPSRDGVSVTMETCNQALCCDTATVTIPVEFVALWIPNTFLPSDADNGYFSVQSSQELLDFEVFIYNRRGLLVYSSRDPHFRWDGTDLHGRPLPQESYIYNIGYRTPATGDYRYSVRGTVTLLR